MTERLYAQQTFEDAVATLLNDVIALHGAEFGDVQLPVGDELVIVAQSGFGPAFLQTFRRVGYADGSACGQALQERRTIVIPDVECDAGFEPFRAAARAAGFRAVQTTPLFTSGGDLMGMVSTHFAQAHRPTEIEMDTLQSYSVCAADYLKELLHGAPLAAKAADMHARLYADFGMDASE